MYLEILDQIERAKSSSSRQGESIEVMAVIKNQPLDKVKTLISEGVTILGENRIQDAALKFPELNDFSIQKHLIGSLQSNKENNALKLFDTIQSIESLTQLQSITKKLQSKKIHKNIYFQMNTSHESSKHGLEDIDELKKMVEHVLSFHHYLSLKGLMTIGALSTDEKVVRRSFAELREIREQILQQFPEISSLKLSMGMSSDFYWAIQEGSDMIRLGTILFKS
ncbi:MAG: YggS family pyridoxal phosphate-dependent enzyme [Brevinema sp.]